MVKSLTLFVIIKLFAVFAYADATKLQQQISEHRLGNESSIDPSFKFHHNLNQFPEIYRKFVLETDLELLIHSPSIHGYDFIRPLEDLKYQTHKNLQITVILDGPTGSKHKTPLALENLRIPTFAFLIDTNTGSRFHEVRYTIIIRDQKDIIIIPDVSLDSETMTRRTLASAQVIYNHPSLASALRTQFGELLEHSEQINDLFKAGNGKIQFKKFQIKHPR